VTSYFEWSSASKHEPNPEFGAMHRAGHILLACFYYGFNEREIYFRFDLDPVATENSSSIDLEIVFPLKNRLIHLSLDLKNPSLKTRFREIGESSDETGGSQGISGENILSSFQKVLEISIPFESLSCNSDDRLDFFLTIQPQGHTGERWPLYGTFSEIVVPRADTEGAGNLRWPGGEGEPCIHGVEVPDREEAVAPPFPCLG
jgi:hypothetical protein